MGHKYKREKYELGGSLECGARPWLGSLYDG
jgi:hypothetical protein